MTALLGEKGPGAMGQLLGYMFEKGRGKQEAPGFSNTARPPRKKKKSKPATTVMEQYGG